MQMQESSSAQERLKVSAVDLVPLDIVKAWRFSVLAMSQVYEQVLLGSLFLPLTHQIGCDWGRVRQTLLTLHPTPGPVLP